MPNRILKESICTSESVDRLPWFEEVLFYRLIVNADDYGRLDARPAILRARLFPLKEIPLTQITEGLHTLEEAGCVIRYEVDGAPYLMLPSWDKHQTIRAKRSKFPPPQADACTCMQMHADVHVIQSESESVSESQSNPAGGGEGWGNTFEEFWQAYPNHECRTEAAHEWERLHPDPAMRQQIMRGVALDKRRDRWIRCGGRYVPRAARYLRERLWEHAPQETRLATDPAVSSLDTAAMDKLLLRFTPTHNHKEEMPIGDTLHPPRAPV